jgi:uroporphyrinogen decarboxylase
MPEVIDYKARSSAIGGNGLLAAGIYSSLSHNAGDAYSIESFMMDCLVRPEFIHRLLDIFHKPIIARLKQGLETGAEMVYCSTFFESMSSGWSPAIYRDFFLPRLKEQVDLAHEYGAIYHHYDDGKVRESLPMLKEIGVDLVSTICPPPSGDVTPGEARQTAGSDLCISGGIDTVNTMWRGTPEEIDQAVQEAIEQAALPEGGYIVGSSDSISEEVTPENVKAMFDAVLKYGQTEAACC